MSLVHAASVQKGKESPRVRHEEVTRWHDCVYSSAARRPGASRRRGTETARLLSIHGVKEAGLEKHHGASDVVCRL